MKTDVSFSHVQFWLYNCRSIATNDCLCRPSISPSMHASFGLRSRVTCWSSPPRNSCCLLFYWRSVALGLNFKNHQSAHCDQPSIVARRIYAHGRIICCSYCSRLVFCWFLTELLWSRVTLSLGDNKADDIAEIATLDPRKTRRTSLDLLLAGRVDLGTYLCLFQLGSDYDAVMLCCAEKDVLSNDQERRERFSDWYYALPAAQSIDRTLLLPFLDRATVYICQGYCTPFHQYNTFSGRL